MPVGSANFSGTRKIEIRTAWDGERLGAEPRCPTLSGPLAQYPERAASIRKVPGVTPGWATHLKYQRGIIVVRLPVKENGDGASPSADAIFIPE